MASNPRRFSHGLIGLLLALVAFVIIAAFIASQTTRTYSTLLCPIEARSKRSSTFIISTSMMPPAVSLLVSPRK